MANPNLATIGVSGRVGIFRAEARQSTRLPVVPRLTTAIHGNAHGAFLKASRSCLRLAAGGVGEADSRDQFHSVVCPQAECISRGVAI